MMSKYSDDRFEEFSYSPASSLEGRRYVLKNFNMRKQRERSYKKHYNRPEPYADYFDIRKAPPSESSRTSKNSQKSNHVGFSNKVMPTLIQKSVSPSKPRDPPLYVTPRKNLNGEVPKEYEGKTFVNRVNPIKQEAIKESSVKTSSQKADKVLTSRDEYMVTKLYAHEIIYLKPSDIRYTHDEITAHFNDGRSMLSTFKSLLYGKIEIRLGGDGVPLIEVMRVEERGQKLWFVINGNRRLFIFRKLEKCGAIETMQVVARRYDSIEMDKHFSTRNLGQTIAVTNDATIREKMSKEITTWREWKKNRPFDKSQLKGRNTKASKAKPVNNTLKSAQSKFYNEMKIVIEWMNGVLRYIDSRDHLTH